MAQLKREQKVDSTLLLQEELDGVDGSSYYFRSHCELPLASARYLPIIIYYYLTRLTRRAVSSPYQRTSSAEARILNYRDNIISACANKNSTSEHHIIASLRTSSETKR